MRRVLFALLGLIVFAIGGAGTYAWFGRSDAQQPGDTSLLAQVISSALSSKTSIVTVGAVDGALTSDALIRDITIADQDGVWLRVDRVRLIWRRAALFQRKLEVQQLEIGTIDFARKPRKEEPAAPTAPGESLLPDLPLRVDIQRFALEALHLGQPVLGVAATIGANGHARLGPPSEGLDLALVANRQDQPGRFDIGVKYVPETLGLTLRTIFNEPQGGLASTLSGLPGAPPVTFDLQGQGTLDQFVSALRFDAGSTIGATGKATLTRNGPGRTLALTLDSRVAGLLPAPAAPVFAGQTSLDGDIFLGDVGDITIRPFRLASEAAELTVNGAIDAEKVADLAIAVRKRDPSAGAPPGDIRIGKLTLDATVKGALINPAIDARFNLADAVTPVGQVASVTANVRSARVAGVDDRVTISAGLEAQGLLAAEPAFRDALGSTATLALEATIGKDGLADVARLEAAVRAATVKFRGKAGAKQLAGVIDLSVPDLAGLSRLAGRPLTGAVTGSIGLDGIPAEKRIAATPDLKLLSVTAGIAALDRGLGSAATLTGRAASLPAGGFSFTDLKLTGHGFTARVDGSAVREKAAVALAVAAPDLTRLDAAVKGRAALDAHLSGSLDHPDLAATLALTDVVAEGRTIPRLTLTANGRDLIANPQAEAQLEGTVGGKPAKGRFALHRAGADWHLDGLDLAIGSVLAKGSVVVANALANGDINLSAADLADIAPLAMTRVAGNLEGKLELSSVDGRQNLAFKGRGNAIRFGANSIDRLVADIRALDVRGAPALVGSLSVDQAEVAGESIRRIRFDAKPPEAGGELTLSANARGFDLAGAGRLEAGEPRRLVLSRLEAKRGGKRVALAQPGTVTFGGGDIVLSRIAIAVEGGRMEADGRVAPDLKLAVKARAVPLAVAELFQPGIGIAGTLNAEAHLAGAPEAPTGQWQASVAGLSLPQTRANGVPPIAITADGSLRSGRTTLTAVINAGQIATLRVSGSAPIDGRGALDIAVNGKADLGLSNRQLAPTGQRLTGGALIDLRVTGPVTNPAIGGGATLQGVAFSDAETGFRLTNMAGRIEAHGRTLNLQNIAGRTKNGGPLAVNGHISLDADAGFPGDITIRATGAELAASTLATAVANVALELRGPLARRPTISGKVAFSRLDITIPERLPASARPLENVRHINVPARMKGTFKAAAADKGTAKGKAQRKGKAKGGPSKRRSSPFDAVLDVTLDAPSRVFVRGRGLDAEMGGSMRLTGTLNAIVPAGSFQMRRGRLTIAGKRLDFTRGRLLFAGDLTPELDFLAQTQASDATVKVGISGEANAPNFAFTAEPDMPEDEVLSRLVFNKASGSLGAAQALQLAMIAAQFASGGGNDAFDRIRKQLGVDSLDVNLGQGGVGIGASRAINDRISIGVRAGSLPSDNAVSADIDVTRNIRIQGEATAGGNTSVGIGFEREY